MDINKKYSHKDFLGQRFLGVDPSEFNGTEIVGSCFYQESTWHADALGGSATDPSVAVFPVGMTGVTFTRCSLDNCLIPPGNVVGERCSHRKIRVQNDNEDWVLSDSDNKPVEPTSKKGWELDGKSVAPKDIPLSKVEVA